jgi:PAS domain S-box-containing protein
LARCLWPAWILLAALLVVSLESWRYALTLAQRDARQQFQSEVHDVQAAISARMATYEQVLRDSAALFAASASVQRQDWQRYVEAARVHENFPGIQALVYVQRIAPHALDTHLRAMRAQGFPDYTIQPPGERAEYNPVVYIEPSSGANLRALGFDLFSEPVRREATERARDSGQAALTGKLRLVQETGHNEQAGTVMLLPVYRQGASLASVAERRAAALGQVAAVFRMADLLHSVRGAHAPLVDLEIYDDTQAVASALLYDDKHTTQPSPGFVHDAVLKVAGRNWLLRMASTTAFEAQTAHTYPTATLATAVALSLLLSGLTGSVILLRQRTQALTSQGAALAQTQARLTFLLENTPAVVYAIKAGGNFSTSFISENVRQLLGYAPSDFTGKPGFWSSHVHPDDLESVQAELQAAFQSGSCSRDYRFRHQDGSWRWMRDEAKLIRDTSGAPSELVGHWGDITARKEAQAALERAQAELDRQYRLVQQANQAKSDFMANVTHELRTPLNAVIGFADLLAEQVPGPLNAQQLEFVKDILASGLRLTKLVDAILNMSCHATDGAALVREPVNIDAAIHECASAHAQAARQRQISVTLEVAPDTGSARLNPQALRQMLDALLANAIKFNHEGGRVALSARRAGTALEIVVTDSGIGIAPGNLGQVFQPLVQLDTSLARQYGGIGMGLTLARRLAELHGGSLDVQSEPGKGSTFTLRLPWQEAA